MSSFRASALRTWAACVQRPLYLEAQGTVGASIILQDHFEVDLRYGIL